MTSGHTQEITSSSAGACSIQLHVCSTHGQLVSTDGILKADAAQTDTQLIPSAGGLLGFVLMKDVVLAVTKRTAWEYVQWLIDEAQYEAAVALAVGDAKARDSQKEEVHLRCVSSLLANREASRAARLVRSGGALPASTWQKCVDLFDEAGMLPSFIPEVPSPPLAVALPRS
eukprot:6470879-Amphidinium_carterae.1